MRERLSGSMLVVAICGAAAVIRHHNPSTLCKCRLGSHSLSSGDTRLGRGPVAGLVGIEVGVVSGVINLDSPGVEAPVRRPRHEECYQQA